MKRFGTWGKKLLNFLQGIQREDEGDLFCALPAPRQEKRKVVKETALQNLEQLIARIHFVGCAVDGGPLDYAGRIYSIGSEECLVRLFSYKEPTGKAFVVVRPDGYHKILTRQDNNIAAMKLTHDLDAILKKALQAYIARSYPGAASGDIVLKLG